MLSVVMLLQAANGQFVQGQTDHFLLVFSSQTSSAVILVGPPDSLGVAGYYYYFL